MRQYFYLGVKTPVDNYFRSSREHSPIAPKLLTYLRIISRVHSPIRPMYLTHHPVEAHLAGLRAFKHEGLRPFNVFKAF